MAAAASALRLVGADETVPDVNVPETADVDTESRQRNSFMSKWTNPDARVHRCGSWPSLPSGRTHRSRSQGGGRTSVELQPAISFPPYVGRSSHATQQRRCGHSQSRPAIRSSLASSGDVSSDITLKRQCERTVLLPHRPLRPCDQTEDASSSRFEAHSPTLEHPDIVRQQPPREVFTYSPRVEPAVTGTDSDPAVRTNWAGAFCPRRSCSVLVGNSKLLVFVTSAVTRR